MAWNRFDIFNEAVHFSTTDDDLFAPQTMFKNMKCKQVGELKETLNVGRCFTTLRRTLYKKTVCIMNDWRIVIACIIHITTGNRLIC